MVNMADRNLTTDCL